MAKTNLKETIKEKLNKENFTKEARQERKAARVAKMEQNAFDMHGRWWASNG